MSIIPVGTPFLPGAHYSSAVIHNDLVYVSAQVPRDTEAGENITGSAGDQTEQVLKNLEAVLKKAGCSRRNVIKTTAYITDIALWGEVNGTYKKFFGDHKPARSIIPVKPLPQGFVIALDAVAHRDSGEKEA